MYFPDQDSQHVITILKCITDSLTVPIDRLHYDDHIVLDLGIGVVDGLESNHIISDIEDTLGFALDINGNDKAETLGQFIEICLRKICKI